jgi:thiamine-monophosphate kinase
LLGGDSVATQGPVTLSVAALGRVAAGRAILRRGAQPGDLVFASGALGDAALGLAVLRGQLAGLDTAGREFLVDRYRLPQPRLALGQRLAGVARAMMDISDGLVADLGHICEVSGVGATVEVRWLPISPAARAAIATDPQRIMDVLGGGDDYELLFTAPASAEPEIAVLVKEVGVPITKIGRIEAGAGVTVLDWQGTVMTVKATGYRHF